MPGLPGKCPGQLGSGEAWCWYRVGGELWGHTHERNQVSWWSGKICRGQQLYFMWDIFLVQLVLGPAIRLVNLIESQT